MIDTASYDAVKDNRHLAVCDHAHDEAEVVPFEEHHLGVSLHQHLVEDDRNDPIAVPV